MAPSKARICFRVELELADPVSQGLFWLLRIPFLLPAPLLLEAMLKGYISLKVSYYDVFPG